MIRLIQLKKSFQYNQSIKFKEKDKPKQNKVGNIISILLVSNQILATTSKGYFLFIDYKSGKLQSYTKASKSGFYSSPSIVNKMIYVIDNKLRVLIFNQRTFRLEKIIDLLFYFHFDRLF